MNVEQRLLNILPTADSLTGGDVACFVDAADSRIGHTLTYAWTATDGGGNPAGTFDDAAAPLPTWTAPENRSDAVSDYTIEVTVSCAGTPAINDTSSYNQHVNPVDHAVSITAGPSGNPNPVQSAGDVACSVTAEDSRDGHTLTYAWTATDGGGNPAGSFDDAEHKIPKPDLFPYPGDPVGILDYQTSNGRYIIIINGQFKIIGKSIDLHARIHDVLVLG